MFTCSLDAFKKFSKRKEMRNKKGKRRGVTTNYIQKGDRKVKDRDDEILSFDFVFVG